MTYLIYLLLGVFAGTLSGLFGIGGGLVIVPTLLFCFKFLGFPEDLTIHMAIGTSLSIIVVTASNSVYRHHKKGGIDWPVVKKILYPLVVGTFIGGQVSSMLSADLLEILFSTYVVLVSIKMFLDVKIDQNEKRTSPLLYSIVGFVIGFKSAILGIGGGTISIPFLSWRGFSMKKAVGVSAALGLPISIVGSASYIFTGLKVSGLPEHSLGYIYIPALVGVILTSSFFAHIGAKLSHKLPQQKMKKGFAIFLSIVAIKMIFF